ncbi:MAG: LruC domain-containing protein, partial [Sphingobacteriaceae bacterium]
MNRCVLPIVLILFSIVTSCDKNLQNPDPAQAGKIAPDGFNFETTKNVNVDIRLLSGLDEPLKGIIVNINSTSGETLLRGATNRDGYFKSTINIPGYIDTLSINPDNTGLNQHVKALIINNNLTCVIGGKNGGSGNLMSLKNRGKIYAGTSVFAAVTYSYMGTFDFYGRPQNYLDSQKGAVTADLITYLAESLPDQQDVRTHHPSYLSDNATKHLNLVKKSDVWITFVSEGGGYTNTIGYYTYPTNNPPNNINKIRDIKYIFPNTSGAGSGGSMQSGDRVNIGNFNAGTSIGFVLIQNGWTQSITSVNSSQTKFYSYSTFNPESSNDLRTHTVLLNYDREKLFIIGFEDLVRSTSGCDHDFNDVVLYASSVVPDAISTAGVEGISPPKDSDADGVWDANDKFPTDATRAYISYFPSENTRGTLTFEDNWPSKGDYDMNDLVVSYRYSYVSNASNQIIEMVGDFKAVAAWAANKNGFGVQLPINPNIISSVTGQKLSSNYITLNTNGTEAEQAKSVIIPFDDHTKLVINQKEVIDSASVKITFTNPIDMATLGTGPYNPFLICNKLRGVEAHLPGHLPTSKANTAFFGTEHDRTNPSSGKYYLSEDNWPWALNFTE